MDAEARDLAIEALTYAWREHCGAVGEDRGGQWPEDERVARSLLVCVERQSYTIVPQAEYERLLEERRRGIEAAINANPAVVAVLKQARQQDVSTMTPAKEAADA